MINVAHRLPPEQPGFCSIMVTKAMVLLGHSDFDELQRMAEAAYPEEFCAILLGRRTGVDVQVERVEWTRNIHTTPRKAFAIDPAELIAAQHHARDEGFEIVGFAHSHPDHAATPSSRDLEEAFWVGNVYAIASIRGGRLEQLAFYRLSGENQEQRRFTVEAYSLVTP